MEIKPGETCILWEGTRELAEERGFELSVMCPMAEHCDTKCVFLSQQKLDEKLVKEKLAVLRQELKSLG